MGLKDKHKKPGRLGAVRLGVITAVAAAVLAVAYFTGLVGSHPKPTVSESTNEQPDTLELSAKQAAGIKVEPVADHSFAQESGAVGSIDYNEDMAVQVFTVYQGRIVQLFAKVGDDVKKGQTLFTIDSPDLVNAESTLIAAAGVLELTTKALARAQKLFKAGGGPLAAVEQAVSDQQTAEGNLKAARDAVRVFGKTEAEVDNIVASRKIDPFLIIPSPIAGRVTARSAQPGLFVQPGNPPAPYTVADLSTMWMLANIIESDIPNYHLGQKVWVTVTAYRDRVFSGKITTIGTTVDPNTHRTFIRSEIDDPDHLLLSGMYAHFVIETGQPVRSPAVPAAAVVREGDGTMTVWVPADTEGRQFVKRIVEIGSRQDGYDQILSGLRTGERVATNGALLLSNMLALRTAAKD
ncbi:MAG TPA: efflux RND transporter periplasmic adaptor subunit [Methylocella sp.]|nr:efflux RND transporter periplasmic adaptor subunit [Methylocella sp.]